MRLAENMKIVPLTNDAGYSGALTMDSVNMRNHRHADVVIICKNVSGSSALKVYSGATAAAKTTAMIFDYAIGSGTVGSSSADVLGSTSTAVAASGMTLTASSVSSAMTVLSIDAAQMDTANAHEWMTVEIDSTASSGSCTAVAILDPRYTSDKSATAI